jgi:hypothetical protein
MVFLIGDWIGYLGGFCLREKTPNLAVLLEKKFTHRGDFCCRGCIHVFGLRLVANPFLGSICIVVDRDQTWMV